MGKTLDSWTVAWFCACLVFAAHILDEAVQLQQHVGERPNPMLKLLSNEEIIELKLTDDEMKLVHDSAKAVKEVMDVLDNMGQAAAK